MNWVNEDALNIIKESSQVMRLNEAALAAIQATGFSLEDFKIRQDLVASIKGDWRSEAQKQIEHDEEIQYIQKTHEEFIWNLYLSGGEMQQKVLPVTMIVDGERVEVGSALIEQRKQGYCVVHAVIDGERNVAALLGPDLSQISIGNKDDFKKEV